MTLNRSVADRLYNSLPVLQVYSRRESLNEIVLGSSTGKVLTFHQYVLTFHVRILLKIHLHCDVGIEVVSLSVKAFEFHNDTFIFKLVLVITK